MPGMIHWISLRGKSNPKTRARPGLTKLLVLGAAQ